MAAYVIKSWSAKNQPDAQGIYVQISARAAGLLSWVLNILGISPTITLAVHADKIVFHKGSLEGSLQFLTPLENTCSTFYGYKKPIKEAVAIGAVGLIILCNAVVGGPVLAFLGIICLAAGIFYYLLNKTVTIGFTDVGGRITHINFKRSVIEGQSIDESATKFVCDLIQFLIDARRQQSGH